MDNASYQTISAKTLIQVRRSARFCCIMRTMAKPAASRRSPPERRIIVVVAPPIEELDLVGPLQVFSSVNRLAGHAIYSIEVVTAGKQMAVNGESGMLTFTAQGRFEDVNGKFDSVLLVCGVGSRTARDPALFSWLRKVAAFGGCLRGLFSARGSRIAEREEGDLTLEVRPRAGRTVSAGEGGIRFSVGQGRKHLHVRRHFSWY
jgi:DJ-1/PfpI family